MYKKHMFTVRFLTVLVLLSLVFSTSPGGGSALASGPQSSPSLQTEKLQATLDGSVKLDSFPSAGTFIIHFNAAIDPESSPNPLLTYPYVEGTASWNVGRNTLSFTPKIPLRPGETYTFFLDPSLSSVGGALFESSPQWNVQIKEGSQVVRVSPAPGMLATRKPVIEVTFLNAMDRDSVEKSLSVQPNVPFKLSWKNDKVLTVQFSELLQFGEQYTLLLAGGSSESPALDTDSTPLAEDYSWSYGLEQFSAEVPAMTSPRAISVNFSHVLSTAKTGFPFRISPSLEGDWRWQGNKTAVFTAAEAVPLGQVYSLEITARLMDTEGEVSPNQASFNFVAPAPVSMVEPARNNNPVLPGFSPIQIEFKTEVNQSSAENAFRISPEIAGHLEWSKSNNSTFNNMLSFFPNELLQSDTEYTIEIGPALTDLKGKPLLLESYAASFHTLYSSYYYGYMDGATFGSGTKVQVVDVLGPRRIQFGAQEKELITFEAYAYDLIDFASLYADYEQGKGIPLPNRDDNKLAATWNYIEVNPDYQETIIPPDVPPGLYILNLKYGGRSFDQLFVALTTNTIVTKQAGDELFVWLTNIHGDNVPEAEIRLYSDRGEKIREGKTDVNGLYRVSIPEGYNPMLVSARSGDKNRDVTISGLDSSWREYSSGYYGAAQTYRYLPYIYTDRPIYRPGQTVNFKAIVRRDNDLKYSVPEPGLPVTVNVRDAKNNLVQTSIFNTNEFGSMAGSFNIGEEAGLGSYKIETVIGGETNSQAFKVQDYRKPDFKVTVAPAEVDQSNKFVNEDKIDLTIDTEYFFGEPVPNAKLTYQIYRLVPRYYWWGWDSDSTDVTYSWYGNAYDPGISTATADANGRSQISFAARFTDDFYFDDYDYWNSSLRSRTYALEVTADDGSNQPVSSAYIFNVYNSVQKMALDTQGYFKTADQPFAVTINTKTLDDQPMADRELLLQVKSWNSKNYNFDTIAETYKIQTDRDGSAKQELKLPSGYYTLVLSGIDERGNRTQYERWLRVLSSAQDWSARYWDPISISADQDEYKPYQMARFAIESTVSGPALLTFERGSVIHSKFITLTAPLTVVEAEIIPEDAPNIFVTVNAWAPVTPPAPEQIQYYRGNIPDSQLLMATTQLKVTADAKKLQVDISADKQIYGPGEEVTVNIDVRDSSGKPALAEVSLALVDEAIFSLSNELAPNIFTAFYGPRDLSVVTFSSMTPYRTILDEGGRGGGGGGLDSGDSPRTDFRDTAAWFPALRTDANGRASVTFNLPDNLTSWRLSAKAITLNHLVGESYTNIETKKDLLLRPLLPRILTTGDQAQLTTMIHNYSNSDQTVRVTLNAPGLKISGDATQTVAVKAAGVMAVGWTVVPEVAKEASIMIVAVSDSNLNDSISLPLPVQPLAVKDVQSQSGRFNGALTLMLPLPPGVLPEASVVTLKLSRTAGSTVLDGLEYLTGYPYGCVEQTMSRAMPNAVLGRASSQLGIGGSELKAQVDPLIQASIQKLLGYQHGNGGWGWWYDDYSDAYQTAWVLHGLSIIRDAGYFIDPLVLENGSDYLAGGLSSMDIRTRAYALYSMALAGFGDRDNTYDLLNASLNELDPFSQAALALTLHQLGEDQSASLVLDQLEKSAVRKGDLAYWSQSSQDGEYHRKTMSSTIRTTAMALSAYTEIRGAGGLTDAAANYLIKNRTGYGWGTTNETSFTILALTDYLAGQQEQSGSSDFGFDLNGEAHTAGTLETGKLFASIDIPIEQLRPGANNIRVTTSGAAPLYYDVVTSFTTAKTAMDAAGRVVVTRRLLDPKTNKPLESITAGQLVAVELVVKMPTDASFVIVEDHLPGGLEALNEGLNSTTQDVVTYDFEYSEERFFWQDFGYNYKEIRGDRVSFFITELDQGSRTLKYYARATLSGTFTALPAEAYAMYDDQIWGRSASLTLEVLPE